MTYAELLALKLRNALAEKEWITAQANRQLSVCDWCCDWSEAQRDNQSAINQLIAEIEIFTEAKQ